MQILRQDEGRGPGSGAQHKHAEAKLALQLASWMAATGQGAKTDITGEHLAVACCLRVLYKG